MGLPWATKDDTADIQQAINTQTIQTALEKSSTALSDPALQSFLTNAPIPRCLTGTIVGTYATGAVTPCVFTRAGSFDPYSMFQYGGSPQDFLRFPVDGFYTVCWYVDAGGGVGAGAFLETVITDSLGNQYLNLNENNTSGAYRFNHTFILPFKAGAFLQFSLFNNTGAVLTLSGRGTVSCVWSAPYNNYVTGGQ